MFIFKFDLLFEQIFQYVRSVISPRIPIAFVKDTTVNIVKHFLNLDDIITMTTLLGLSC